jgi:hypothetical protein
MFLRIHILKIDLLKFICLMNYLLYHLYIMNFYASKWIFISFNEPFVTLTLPFLALNCSLYIKLLPYLFSLR